MHFKYRLSVMNESTLEELWKVNASMFSGIALLLIFAFFLIVFTSVIIIATPIRYYLPGYLDAEVREKAMRSAIKIDSLEHLQKHQEAYISNLKKIFDGTMQIDSVKILDTISVSENDVSLKKTSREKEYTEQYEEEEKYNLSVLDSNSTLTMEGTIFFKPVRAGVISQKFDPSRNNYGIAIKIPGKETISAVLEGVVVATNYDINDGHSIQIQHKNGFLSTYKNTSFLLKKVGDKVKTGEAISIIDFDKESTQKPSLYLEFWYKGNPINPEDYISF